MKDYTKLSPDEKDALVKKAMDVGFQTETDYGNCIQSCLNGLYEAFPDLGITKDMLKASLWNRRRLRLLSAWNLWGAQRRRLGDQPLLRQTH